jgi:ferredoxin-NADP reductase
MHSALPEDALVLTVRAVIPATPTTRILRFDLSRSPFAFEAGQAALIGPAEQDLRIPYSIASAPTEAREHGWLDFLVKVEPSGRWGHQFDAVVPGNRVGVQGPFGSFLFPVRPAESHFLFIAGGTGIAPIRAMIKEALLRGQPGRMRLLYSAKTGDDFAYLPELGEMATHGRPDGALDLRLHVTREASDASLGAGPSTPPGTSPATVSRAERGRITLSQLTPLIDDPATLCFVCGPETMVADVPRMLTELGIERSRVRVEEW